MRYLLLLWTLFPKMVRELDIFIIPFVFLLFEIVNLLNSGFNVSIIIPSLKYFEFISPLLDLEHYNSLFMLILGKRSIGTLVHLCCSIWYVENIYFNIINYTKQNNYIKGKE